MLKQIYPSVFTFTRQLVGRSYLVQDDDGLTLIDTGSALMTKSLLRSLKQSGFKLENLKRIVITHAHPDHAGSLPLLKSLSGAEIYAPAKETDVIEGKAAMESLGFLKGIAIPAWVPGSRLPACEVDHPLEEGAHLPFLGGMTALETPGHTSGQMSYWQPEKRVLFCGDVLIRFPNTRLPFALFTQDMEEDVRSLIRLSALAPQILLPGHGKPITRNTAEHVRVFTDNQARKFDLQTYKPT